MVQNSTDTIRKFETAFSAKNYERVRELIHDKLEKSIAFSKLKSLSRRFAPLKAGIHGCEKLTAVHGARLKRKEALELAYFIHAIAPRKIATGPAYFPRDRLLPRAVQYDFPSKKTFIHLKCHNGAKKLGEGAFKEVTLSIQYDQASPKLVACAEAKGNIEKEVTNLYLARGLEGVIQVKAVMRRKGSSGDKTALIFDLYSPGALTDERMHKLPFDKRVKVAKKVLLGLEGLHKRGVIHRDIKPKNIFISDGPKGFSACLSDLGQGLFIHECPGKTVNCTPHYNPPEALGTKPINYEKADIFSLGMVIYQLAFSKKLPWASDKYLPEWIRRPGKISEKAHLQKKLISKIEEVRKRCLSQIYHMSASRGKTLKKIAVDMLHPNPDKRPKIHDILFKLK
jgi:hypothetical protein